MCWASSLSAGSGVAGSQAYDPWGAVSAGVDTVQSELKLIRAAAARIRDIPHVVVDAASSGIRKLGSVAARVVTYVRPLVRAVTAPVRAGVRLVKTAVRKAVSAGRRVVSAVRRAASATAFAHHDSIVVDAMMLSCAPR
jgi:hypothetical protein